MEWEETRHGGWRRTRLPQKMGTSTEVTSEPKIVATVNGEGVVESGITSEEDSPHTGTAGGSNPSPRAFIFKFNEHLGLPECPYLIRWRLETPWGSVRLHHWLSHDDDRALHDHPWDFVTLVVKGGYVDKSDVEEHLRAPCVAYRKATHQHTVYPDKGGAWTIVLTGPKIRPWGFWVKGKFKKANKYFLSHGHHPCE